MTQEEIDDKVRAAIVVKRINRSKAIDDIVDLLQQIPDFEQRKEAATKFIYDLWV